MDANGPRTIGPVDGDRTNAGAGTEDRLRTHARAGELDHQHPGRNQGANRVTTVDMPVDPEPAVWASRTSVQNRLVDDVLVLGAGVIGLTTAVCLAEAGLTVRIRAAQLPQATTSVVAGAMWGRGPGVLEPADRIDAWIQSTLLDLTALADDPATGVRFARGREATREPTAVRPVPGTRDVRRCTEVDLPD